MENRHLTGILIAIAGGAFLSTSGILLRLMDTTDGWQILFFRSLAFSITILVVVIFRYRRKSIAAYRAIGLAGVAAATFLGLGSVCYIFAMLNTTVANVVFIIGSGPLITAFLAWLFLKEKINRWSLLAMFFALLGIGLMFIDGLVNGGMIGNILALILVIMFAFYLLILRAKKQIDMIPAIGLSGLITLSVAAPMVTDFTISNHDLLLCVALGTFQLGLGFLLLTLAIRLIQAAEVALFALSESILSPIWVWIGVNEIPSNHTLVGSAIVLVSVVAYSIIAVNRERL